MKNPKQYQKALRQQGAEFFLEPENIYEFSRSIPDENGFVDVSHLFDPHAPSPTVVILDSGHSQPYGFA